jgi:23S rRNA (uracil1939-C5)-methyltransferase
MKQRDERRPAARRGGPGGQAIPVSGLIEGTISALNEFGDGVFKLRERTIKVARTLPGDRVRVRLPAGDRRFVYGELVKLLAPSPDRIDPGCEAFGAGCGGCQWLGLPYAGQLRWKDRILRELFRQRCPAVVRIDGIVAMDDPEAYRNKLSARNEAGRAVFMQEFGDRAIAPAACRVETPANQAFWQWLRGLDLPPDVLQIHARSVAAEAGAAVGIHLHVRRHGPQAAEFARRLMAGPEPASPAFAVAGVGASCREDYRLLGGIDCLEHRVDGLVFRIPHNGFFQTNYRQAGRLLELALARLAPRHDEALLDLYCGAGFFSLPLARRGRRVLGIESNSASVQGARANARLNGLANAEFLAADVAAGLAGLRAGDWPAVLLDPPRSGCEPEVLDGLLRLRPRRLVYVSCSPDTLARDLKVLVKGGYLPRACQPVDMFPHSFHCECVVSLDRAD